MHLIFGLHVLAVPCNAWPVGSNIYGPLIWISTENVRMHHFLYCAGIVHVFHMWPAWKYFSQLFSYSELASCRLLTADSLSVYFYSYPTFAFTFSSRLSFNAILQFSLLESELQNNLYEKWFNVLIFVLFCVSIKFFCFYFFSKRKIWRLINYTPLGGGIH